MSVTQFSQFDVRIEDEECECDVETLTVERRMNSAAQDFSDTTGRVPFESAISREGLLFAAPKARIENLIATFIAIEFLSIASICVLTNIIYFKLILKNWPSIAECVGAAGLIATCVVVPALMFKQYAEIQTQSRDRLMWSGIGAVTLSFALFLSILFVFKIGDWYSRGTLVFQYVTVAATVLVARGVEHNYLRRAIKNDVVAARRAVFIGRRSVSDASLRFFHEAGVRWADILELPGPAGNRNFEIGSETKELNALVDQCRRLKPDDILLSGFSDELSRLGPMINALAELPVAVHIIPFEMNELWGGAKIGNLGRTPTIQVLRPPLSKFDIVVKRTFDLCVASLSVLMLSPFFVIVSLAIKLDSRGPAFFRQNRHGHNNEVIPVIKFRTMTVVEDAETAETFTQAKSNDSRVTRVGRILRRTNIDELPQLFNIIRGEMSLVGPRPHPIALNELFRERIAPFSQRHNVKPGLTGWAQVNGFRGETDTIEKMRLRVEHDLYYVENWSFVLDLKIILMTLFSKSAYQNAL